MTAIPKGDLRATKEALVHLGPPDGSRQEEQVGSGIHCTGSPYLVAVSRR